MSSHSLAEASERLSELVERALRGETVVIMRDGKPVAESRAVAAMPAAPDTPSWKTPADSLEWIRRGRVGRLRPGAPDAASLVSRMRDEDWA